MKRRQGPVHLLASTIHGTPAQTRFHALTILRRVIQSCSVPENPHFESAADWADAAGRLTFVPLVPRFTAGGALKSLRIHVRDHRLRELRPGERIVEAYYGTFAFSQARRTPEDARHAALEVSYGGDPRPLWILGREGRGYELGPVPEPDDIDPRTPSVVAWADGEMFYFLASGQLPLSELIDVATSIY